MAFINHLPSLRHPVNWWSPKQKGERLARRQPLGLYCLRGSYGPLSSPSFLQLLRILSPLQRQDKEPLLSSPAHSVLLSNWSSVVTGWSSQRGLVASPLLFQLPSPGRNKLQSLIGLLAVTVCPSREPLMGCGGFFSSPGLEGGALLVLITAYYIVEEAQAL